MKKKAASKKRNLLQTGLLLLSICVAAYWIVANQFDIYMYVPIGVLYEILWLPMLVLLPALPGWALYQWVKSRFSFQSVYPFIVLIFIFVLLMFIFSP
ncbi:MAG: hypothetical protein WAR78_04885 [Ferruginibacter sp.]